MSRRVGRSWKTASSDSTTSAPTTVNIRKSAEHSILFPNHRRSMENVMRRTNSILFLLLALIGTAAKASPEDLTATLTVSPQESLPAVPVSFRVRIENHAASDITMHGGVRLHVTSGAGWFEAKNWGEDVAFFSTLPSVFTIPAHGVIEAFFPIDMSLVTNGWFTDPRLIAPGDYSVYMTLMHDSSASQQEARKHRPPSAHVNDTVLGQKIQASPSGISFNTNTA